MQGEYPYIKLGSYPHMKPEDTHLWEKFIGEHPGLANTCDYDVKVGEGVVIGDPKTDPYARGFQELTQKKIDVVTYKGDNIYIFEIKPLAGAHALGQVLSYGKLWRDQHPGDPNPVLVILTNEPQSDFLEIYTLHGITLFTTGFCPGCSAIPESSKTTLKMGGLVS